MIDWFFLYIKVCGQLSRDGLIIHGNHIKIVIVLETSQKYIDNALKDFLDLFNLKLFKKSLYGTNEAKPIIWTLSGTTLLMLASSQFQRGTA